MNIQELKTRLETLEAQVKAQEKELTILKDIEAIKKLQEAYGYYKDYFELRPRNDNQLLFVRVLALGNNIGV